MLAFHGAVYGNTVGGFPGYAAALTETRLFAHSQVHTLGAVYRNRRCLFMHVKRLYAREMFFN